MLKDVLTKEVKFVDDPKNLSALAKIHEMSDKAKTQRRRKSPTFINRIHVQDDLNLNKIKADDPKWARRSSHFATTTMRTPIFNLFQHKDEFLSNLGKEKGKTGSKGPKSEFVWDKNINRLVEKTVPIKEEAEESGENEIKKEKNGSSKIVFDKDLEDEDKK